MQTKQMIKLWWFTFTSNIFTQLRLCTDLAQLANAKHVKAITVFR